MNEVTTWAWTPSVIKKRIYKLNREKERTESTKRQFELAAIIRRWELRLHDIESS